MPEKKIDTAADLAPGEKASIVKISGKTHLKRKLLDMGVVAGSVIGMVRRAPLGDPIDIKIKGYHLSLRKSEARHITIKRIK
jgi:Fe2+ transport system protein FeoA